MKYPALAAIFLILSNVHLSAQSDSATAILSIPTSKYFSTTEVNNAIAKNVTVSSFSEQDVREAPGTILVLDRQEILASGARDIMELLSCIPGFNFALDVDGVIGLGIRGNWAHEGKFLMMYNGIPLNEFDFGTFAFSQRVNLSNINRIEILNGPGSIIYGGTAALGIINLVTFKPGENDGTTISAENAFTKEGFARFRTGLTGNHYLGNETFVSYDLSMSQGNKSNALSEDEYGSVLNYKDSTDIRSSEVYVRIQRKNLGIQYYSNDYNFGVVSSSYRVQMQTSAAELIYDKKLNLKHRLQIKPVYQFQMPWSYQNASDAELNAYNTNVRKWSLYTQLASNWSRKFHSSIGLQLFSTTSKYELEESVAVQNARSSLQKMNIAAGFADVSAKFKIGNFNAGVRGEINNQLPAQLLPRLAYSKVLGKVYIKASYAYACKIPTIQNLLLGPADTDLKVEKVKHQEFQIGCDISKYLSAQGSVYNSIISNPIVYYSDTISIDNYLNRTKAGTSGFELSFNIHSKKITGNIGYCYFKNNGSVSDFPDIVNSKGEILAFPNHRVCSYLRYRYNDSWAFNFRTIAQNRICTYRIDEETGASNEVDIPRTLLLSADVDFSFPALQSFSFRVGVQNILNTNYCIVSPYNSGVPSMQMNGREFKIELKYQITK